MLDIGSFINKILSIVTTPSEIAQQKISKQKEYCEQLIKSCLIAEQSIESLFSVSKYIDICDIAQWQNENTNLYKSVNECNNGVLNRIILSEFRDKLTSHTRFYQSIDSRRKNHNIKYITRVQNENQTVFSSVEGRPLDAQQIQCILKEDTNNLVVAGAGSGKTTMIVGKVKYLIISGQCKVEDILVISFTNASATEMAERIKAETSLPIDVMTFHKLGIGIIAEVEGKKPSITKIELFKFVKDSFTKCLNDSEYLKLFIRFFSSYLKEYKSQFDCSTEQEYQQYALRNSIQTLKGEKVKSYEEMEIANFLFLNGIEYIYEHPYKIATATVEFGQYMPDFYLLGYEIYIEHFAINRNGDVPAFFKPKNGMTAREAYQAGIRWKRDIHKTNSTKLIETYSYEKSEDKLTENLQNKLLRHGVSLNPLSQEEIVSAMKKDSGNEFSGMIKLIATFINLAKSKGSSIAQLRDENSKRGILGIRNSIILNLIEPICADYNRTLTEHGEIDFNDMINRAAEYVQTKKYTQSYKHILVDEYQDISAARYRLIKVLRDCGQSKVFCVGDDWQSIYRFAGSDISFFTNFEAYWGPTERSLIETTYRFPRSIVDVSSTFVLKNTAQVKKELRTVSGNDSFCFGIIQSNSERFVGTDLKAKLGTLPPGSSVFLIGRYNQDITPFLSDDFQIRNDKHTERRIITYSQRKDLQIEFMSAHKSKGLQADYVFIINNRNERLGFPSNMQGDSLLELVLEKKEDYPHAEERRLFYVAMTRARKFVWFAAIKDKKSIFLSEIERTYGEMIKDQARKCPSCNSGKLVYRKGQYGTFWGCSNYPDCKHTQKTV